jgi:hypothetical protein
MTLVLVAAIVSCFCFIFAFVRDLICDPFVRWSALDVSHQWVLNSQGNKLMCSVVIMIGGMFVNVNLPNSIWSRNEYYRVIRVIIFCRVKVMDPV